MIGDRFAIATTTLAADGNAGETFNFTPTDFRKLDGTVLTSADSVIVRTIISTTTCDFRRTGDPDGDGTFEINILTNNNVAAGQTTGLARIITEVAGLEIDNEGLSQSAIVVIAEDVAVDVTWVEQSTSLAEINRTPAQGIQETTIEFAASVNSDVFKDVDLDDDGTFEENIQIFDNITSREGQFIPDLFPDAGRANPITRTRLATDAGGTAQLIMLGTRGGEAL